MGRYLGVALLVFAAETTALAQEQESPQVREARTHFELADQHYAAADYALALNEWQQSYDLLRSVNHPNAGLILFNIARCYARLGREREAIDAYRRMLAEAPASATAQRAEAESELRELEARQALSGGGGGISPIGPIIAAVGAAAVIAGAITGGLAIAANDGATAGCVAGSCPPENEPHHDDAVLLGTVTDGLLWPGLAIVATGLVLTFVLPGDDGSSGTVSAACTGSGCSVIARGAF